MFNTPVRMRFARCWPRIGTSACSPIGAHMARSGGISLKMVESMKRQTVRFRPWRLCFSPLFPVARWGNVVPVSVAVVCSDSANSAKPAARLTGLPRRWYAAELGTATLAPSSCAHEIHSAVGHAAKHAQSLSGPASVDEASDRYVVRLGSVPAQALALVLGTAFSSVERFADSCPTDPPLSVPSSVH